MSSRIADFAVLKGIPKIRRTFSKTFGTREYVNNHSSFDKAKININHLLLFIHHKIYFFHMLFLKILILPLAFFYFVGTCSIYIVKSFDCLHPANTSNLFFYMPCLFRT